MPKSLKSPKLSSRSRVSRGSPASRGSRSKNSFLESKWVYVIVAVLLLISAVFFFSTPVEKFSNPDESTPLSMPRLEYFYMTTCPHCEEFSPIWDKVVQMLTSEQVKITAIKHNINDEGAGEKRAKFFNIQSAPTILYVYGPEKDNKYEYSTPRTAEAIVAYVKSKLGTAAASS